MATKLKQMYRHVPEDGLFGDCHRACYASILEVPIEEIPHFFDQDRSWEESQPLFREVWDRFKIRELQIIFPEGDLDLIMQTLENLNPGVPYILGGRSRSGVNHSVVCVGGEIFCDPSLNDSGIIGPTEPDKFYWVTYLVGEIQHLSSEHQGAKVVTHE
jgi:hypothetical protein